VERLAGGVGGGRRTSGCSVMKSPLLFVDDEVSN